MKIKLIQRFGKIFYLISGFGLFLLGLILDVISKNVGSVFAQVDLIKIGVFVAFYLFIQSYWKRESIPLKRLTAILILGTVVLGISLLLSVAIGTEFEFKGSSLIPIDYSTIFISNALGVIIGVAAIILILLLKDILIYKPRSYTKRNFLILVIGLIAATFSAINLNPYDSRLITTILFGLFVVLILINSFRMPWIVFLKKREKILTIVFTFSILVILTALGIIFQDNSSAGKALLYYSHSLKYFVDGTFLFVFLYSLIAFLSTIFNLPTSDTFDRKMSEVASLHNLSKLVTQLLDFNELVDSVTGMTLQVCEAKSSWLEILHPADKLKSISLQQSGFYVASQKNISANDIKNINMSGSVTLRESVVSDRKTVMVDDFKSDSRTRHLNNLESKIGSILAVPLIARNELVGILYATKETEFGFDREDLEVISAFADQAAVAVDNSRLIEKSFERERLMREMNLAQQMQKKLLPQSIPNIEHIELEAFSSPAFEVGGDYYDFMMIDDKRLAIVIGDVSGKGVSAAFYMAEMKGVFQSLCRIYPSPKDFLIKANQAISSSIDKRSFISLIYAVIDTETGIVTSARAGHCPFILATETDVNFVRPGGIGLGMGNSELFAKYIQESNTQLLQGDTLIFYTDGITEAHSKDGEEFGYSRLLEAIKNNRNNSAIDIRDGIILSVNKYMNNQPPHDDITLIILKWMRKS